MGLYQVDSLNSNSETHWRGGAGDTDLGIKGKEIDFKAMGPDELCYGRGPKAKTWILQHLENKQRRRQGGGD